MWTYFQKECASGLGKYPPHPVGSIHKIQEENPRKPFRESEIISSGEIQSGEVVLNNRVSKGDWKISFLIIATNKVKHVINRFES